MISYFLLTPLFVFLANILALAPVNKEVEHYSILESSKIVQLNEDFSINYKVEKTIIIWDKKGLHHARLDLSTSGFSNIVNFEAEVVNPANGRVIKKYKAKDLQELKIADGVDFYHDVVSNIFNPTSINPPMKVTLSYEYLTKGNYFISGFDPYEFDHQKVKKSDLVFKYPESMGLRYKLKNIDDPIITKLGGGQISLTWKLEDLDPIDKDYDEEVYPRIFFAPQEFSFGGYGGRMDSWEDLAKWFYLLNKDKGTLPEDFKTKVRKMVEGVEDDLEKATILYQYIQKNYRYVAISLGIGGWMSAPAEDTIKNKYGECKALSTLLKAMLAEVGIASEYVLVRAGKNADPLDAEFVRNQFNHVFLRIPVKDKMYWVECTSPYGLVGFSGTFTYDRDVLVVKEDGGYITRTPDYKEDKFNSISSNLNVKLLANGHAEVKGENSYSGFLAADINAYKYYLDNNKAKEYILKNIASKGLDFETYTISEYNKPDLPEVHVNFEGSIQHFAQQTAKRLIIPAQWADLHAGLLPIGKLKFNSVTSVETDYELETDNLLKENSGEYFSIKTLTKKTGLGFLIEQEIRIDFPKDIEDDLKASQLYKINSLAKADILLKKK